MRERFSNTVAVNISANFPGCLCYVKKSTIKSNVHLKLEAWEKNIYWKEELHFQPSMVDSFLHLCNKERNNNGFMTISNSYLLLPKILPNEY